MGIFSIIPGEWEDFENIRRSEGWGFLKIRGTKLKWEE